MSFNYSFFPEKAVLIKVTIKKHLIEANGYLSLLSSCSDGKFFFILSIMKEVLPLSVIEVKLEMQKLQSVMVFPTYAFKDNSSCANTVLVIS